MLMIQCPVQKPFPQPAYGISCDGKAARLRMTLGSSILSNVGRRDNDTRTGIDIGYRIGAGSNAAGTRIRCLSFRFGAVEFFRE